MDNPITERRLLRVRDAADYLGLSKSTIDKLRVRGTGPAYSTIGRRIVLYAVSDLDAWVAARRRTSTSDPGGAS